MQPKLCGLSAIFLVMSLLWTQGAQGQEALPVVARVGPWPVVSKLVVYDGRLWFANSVKGRNHNSADLYSYDPANGALRYERQLFSQDAGNPLVAGGLLYWPFEDARFSLGWGHFLVTDGEGWRLGVIPTARIFHSHALAERGPELIAATSAWRAGLQASDDGGATWRQIYDHPTPPGRVTRIVKLLATGDWLFGELVARDGAGPLNLSNGQAEALPGWPRNSRPRSLAVFQGALYGLVGEQDGAALWRSDGETSRRLPPPEENWPAGLLAAGPDSLWVATEAQDGWLLWESANGLDWQARYRLADGRPHEILITAAGPFVAGAGADGQGILWGPEQSAPLQRDSNDANLPDLPHPGLSGVDWTAAASELDRALADPTSYAQHGRALRDRVFELARAGPPPEFFAERLAAAMPDEPLSLIGGATTPSATALGHWILLWGMTLSGSGRVPLELISAPWTETDNAAEKYFAAPPAAILAAGSIGQNDRATIDALIERLDRPSDPPWLRGDVIGGLTQLTRQRFAYDVAAWRAWWKEARQDWPD